MTLASGRRLGPYEIVAPIGAGGMGEVWRARDTRLDRTVAIKVLPAELSANAHLKVRFEREAKTISQLTHPHICTLYDVGHADGIDFLVMEHLEGESLADRLAKGPLPMEQVLRYGVEIAEALERAHRAGVVHRDLKPGNIMLTKSGAKLLDFGLAKPVPFLGGESAATEHKPLTAEGTIVGTFQYMAPEQIEGRDADQRTDLFAFGVVLYEMATGKRAFEGKTRASLIAAILDREPEPITNVQPLTPPAFEHVVRRCLAKDPDDRWQTAHDVRLQLEWITHASGFAVAPQTTKRRVRDRVAWTAFALALLAAIALAVMYGRRPAERPLIVEAMIPPPETLVYGFRAAGGPPAISPDGTKIAFAAKESVAHERGRLWVRSLGDGEARPINGSDNATYPFWSPDGSQIGFFADGKLKKVALNGTPPVVLCDAPSARGGTWRGDTILFGSRFDALYRTTSSGSPPVRLTKLDAAAPEVSHRWPLLLDDGKQFLYLSSPTGSITPANSLWISSLDQPERRRRVVQTPANVALAGGYLFYVRDRALVAQKFDPKKLVVTGDPIPIAPGVALDFLFSRAMFDVSDTTLVLQAGGGESTVRLVLMDRNGGVTSDYQMTRALLGPRLSPDEKTVAVMVLDSTSGQQNIWLFDLARRTMSRITFGLRDLHPVWSPDGKWIAYSTDGQGPLRRVMIRASDGSGAEREVLRGNDLAAQPTSWSPDGRSLIVVRRSPNAAQNEIWIVPVADGKARPLLHGRAYQNARISPDGRWLAYTADENGTIEVYLTRFPEPAGKWQVSSGNGRFVHWSHDGRQLYYVGGNEMLTAVAVGLNGEIPQLSSPVALFRMTLGAPVTPYDVTKNGTFIVAAPVFDESEQPLTLITNWKAKIGAK